MDFRLRALERAVRADPGDPVAFIELALLRNRLGVCGLCGLVKNTEPDSANVFTMIRGNQIAVDQICLAERRLLTIEQASDLVFRGIVTNRVIENYPNAEVEMGVNFFVVVEVGIGHRQASLLPYALVVAILDPFRAVDRQNNTIRLKRGNFMLDDVPIEFTVHPNKRVQNSHLLASARVREAQQLWVGQQRELLAIEGRL